MARPVDHLDQEEVDRTEGEEALEVGLMEVAAEAAMDHHEEACEAHHPRDGMVADEACVLPRVYR